MPDHDPEAARQRYAAVDRYLDDLYGPGDPALEGARARAAAEELPDIAVSVNLGRYLHVLALACRARRILEIGTLGGYSAIWMARALPADGRLVTLEADGRHAAVARANLEEAGVAALTEVRVGAARESLADLEREDVEPFDMVFIDADKEPYAAYLSAAVRLTRTGSLIVADNVVRGGAVADGPSEDAGVTGVQRFNEALAAHPRLASVIVQQVGDKGHDGMALAVVTG